MTLHSIPRGSILAAACLCSLATFTHKLEAAPRFEVVQGFELGAEQPYGSLITDAAGNKYGTSFGGAGRSGTVFRLAPDGTISILHHFDYVNGEIPGAQLAAGADGNFYGISHGGGSVGGGNVFRVTPAGEFTVLHDFTGGADGRSPGGSLLAASDGNFYGATVQGGANDRGTFFRITPAGVLTTLRDWAQDAVGWQPSGNLIEGSDGNFYGLTRYNNIAGHTDSGQIYRITPGGSASVVGTFAGIPSMDGCSPSSLMQASDGNFYGLTQAGGSGHRGTVFKATPSGAITLLAQFGYQQSAEPGGLLEEGPDGKLYGTSRYGGTAGHGTIFSVTKSGSLTILANLDHETGPANPTGGLTLEPDGSFLGVSEGGGDHHFGTVFRMTAAGEITVASHFKGSQDNRPTSKLLLASDGNFYGRTTMGGLLSNGVFKVTPDGELTTFPGVDNETIADYDYHSGFAQGSGGDIFNFNAYTGEFGWGEIYRFDENFGRETFYSFGEGGGYVVNSLISDANGNLYGTTSEGGAFGGGTVFKVDPQGAYTLLAELGGEFSYLPNPGLTLASDGCIYGTTQGGGNEQLGTVFKVSPEGVLTTHAQFTNAEVNGRYAKAGVMEASDGNLYGVLSYGGPSEAGTIYKVTPAGEITTLHAFDIVNGGYPVGQLTEGPDGALYGVTLYGGILEDGGTVFRITKAGDYSTVFKFDNVHGKQPLAGLTAGMDGSLYGTTPEGGVTSDGRLAGGGQIFRIVFGAEVETGIATAITSSSATLNATVNPGGYATTVSFQYGTSPDLASFSTVSAGILPAGTEPVNVEAEISGLAPGATYYFRVVAVNDENPLPRSGEIAFFEIVQPAEIEVATSGGRVLSDGSIVVFGLTNVGGSGNLTLSIGNTSGTSALTGVDSTISGSGVGHFSITAVPDTTVPAGSSTACTVRFQPTSLGLKTTNLTITSSDPDESPMTIHVYGIALPGSLNRLFGATH